MDPSRVIGPSTEWREWMWEFLSGPGSVQGSGVTSGEANTSPPPSFRSLACRRKPKTRDIMQEKLTSFSLCDVLLSCNKSSPTKWLKTTWMHYLTVMEGRSLKWVGGAVFLMEVLGENPIICLFQFLEAPQHGTWLMAPHHSYLRFFRHSTFFDSDPPASLL